MGWLAKDQIKFDAHTCESSPQYLVVTCEGEYRDGCKGNPDAEAIRIYTRKAVDRHSCKGVILDYTKLAYRWGDMIEGTVDVETEEGSFEYIPAVIVVGDTCREALRTLFLDDYPIFCADSIAEAIVLLEERIGEETGKANKAAWANPLALRNRSQRVKNNPNPESEGAPSSGQ